MKHEQVSSSHVHSVGYDADSRKLQVKYKNGHTWQYDDVPPEEHESLMGADSVGSTVHEIKAKYAGRRV